MEKERRTKILVAVVLLIVVAGLTIAFASLSNALNIKGTAYLDAARMIIPAHLHQDGYIALTIGVNLLIIIVV